MKKNNLLLLILLLAFAFAITGCGNDSNQAINKEESSPPPLIIPPLPSEVVEIYMQHTLGTIPDAKIDYDEARKYLADELKQQFANPMFVPTSYCIQDGPTDVKIISDEIKASSISVVVGALYGNEWQDMWEFLLVPDKANENNHWLIKEIKCLNYNPII